MTAGQTAKEHWDMEADVVVIGFGGAGVSAAIEAAEAGADVLAFDRFAGGGATRKSAGVMYCGGGTELQKKAGFDDTPEQMLTYLRQESVDTVSDETLVSFCDQSVANHEWVKGFGVPYPDGFEEKKTSYPSSETTLYYSGNETSPPFSEAATPAARGHRAFGKGLTGKILFDPLKKAALKAGVRFKPYARCRDLLCDADGRVIGAEITVVRFPPLHWLLWLLSASANNLGAVSVIFLAIFSGMIRGLEWFGKRIRVRAKGGVVIAAGGFIFDRELTLKHLPECRNTMRLGTIGDDGTAVKLGTKVGAGLKKMDRSAIWLFFNPPRNFLYGILLDRKGERICNEELYGATLAMHMVAEHDGKAILLLDKKVRDQVRQELKVTKGAHFQVVTAFTHLFFNRKKANDLATLERKCKVPAGSLQAAVQRYNGMVEAGADVTGKHAEFLQKLEQAPWYAVNVDLDNWRYIRPSITLGGLNVDGVTAQVLTEDSAPVHGLFAVGRSAVGICSHSYVTGFSIGGAIFSGRNAGRSAARAAKGLPLREVTDGAESASRRSA